MKLCPNCGAALNEIIGGYKCPECDSLFDDNDNFEETDYDSMINNGDEICLNCTFWSVSPYGRAYGMICRKGYPTNGPEDSCSEFVQEHYFASYGDDGQYQFDETNRHISNKLYNWKH